MQIFINEKPQVHLKISLFEARDIYKPEADLVILNGHIMESDVSLEEKDRVVLIEKRGKFSQEELESFIVARHTPGVHEKIKNSSVAIAGLGGLGSNIAVSLCRMGIGKLVICDFDIVEPTNINRQAYFLRHIGMKKTHALKEMLEDINPYVKVETVDQKLDEKSMKVFCERGDIVIEAFDKAKYKSMIAKVAIEDTQKTIISASGLSGYRSSNSIRTRRLGKRLYLVGDLVSEAKPGDGLMAPRVMIAANHQANMAVRLLMGEIEP